MRVVLNRWTPLRPASDAADTRRYVDPLQLTLRLQIERGDEVTAFPGAWAERGLHLWRHVGRTARPGRRGRDFMGLAFRSFCAVRSFDLYHEPYSFPLPSSRPTVTTVHDVSPLLHPEWHSPERVAFYRKHLRAGLDRSEHLIVPTESLRQELIREFGVAPSKVTPIPFGVAGEFHALPNHLIAPVLRRLCLPPRYFLVVSPLEPRTNLVVLLRAYCRLPRNVRAEIPLVLVGAWGWKCEALADLVGQAGRHGGILHLHSVEESDLPALYGGALALCVPSLHEGFCHPAAEMLACGGTVLASNAPGLIEVVGRKGTLLDPHDEDGWRRALLRLGARDEWTGRPPGESGAAFSWLRCAQATWTVYRRTLGLEPPAVPIRRAA